MITAEIALGMTSLGLVLAAGLWTVSVVADQMRCQDAARDVARALARGETEQSARAEGRHTAPAGAVIRVAETAGRAEVVITAIADPAWPVMSGLGRVEVRADAAVVYEPGEPTDPAGDGPMAPDGAIPRSGVSR